MKKRFLTLLLASVMLVACGKQETKKEEVKQTQKVEEKKENKTQVKTTQKTENNQKKEEKTEQKQNDIKTILKNQTQKGKGFAKIITSATIFEEKNHKEISEFLDSLLKESGVNYIALSLDNGKDYYINTSSIIVEATFNQDFSIKEQKEFYMFKDGVYKTDDGKVLK